MDKKKNYYLALISYLFIHSKLSLCEYHKKNTSTKIVIYLPISFCKKGPSWLLSYGSLIYNYLCNECLLPLMLWGRISIRARCTTLCDNVCQWLATGRWFSSGPPVPSTNKTDHHDITEILLKVACNTIKQTSKQTICKRTSWYL